MARKQVPQLADTGTNLADPAGDGASTTASLLEFREG